MGGLWPGRVLHSHSWPSTCGLESCPQGCTCCRTGEWGGAWGGAAHLAGAHGSHVTPLRAALTHWWPPVSPTWPQHLAVHPNMKLWEERGRALSWGLHAVPPSSCLHPQTNSSGEGGKWQLPPVLYLAASTGLAWDRLLPSGTLHRTGLWGAGRAAQVPFLPGCLGLPLGLAVLQVLTTILRLWIWLQLQEHKGLRNHSCG